MTTPAAVEPVTPAVADVAAAAALATPVAPIVPTPEAPASPEAPTAPAAEPAPPAAPVVPVVPVVPETYDLKLPDGLAADSALVERTTATARALGLSNEAAQTLLDRDVEAAADAETAVKAGWDAQVKAWSPGGDQFTQREKEWNAAALADPELGKGDPKLLALANEKAGQALARFAPELVKEIEAAGWGSNPSVIKAFARIGNAMSEGKIVHGTPVPEGKKLALGLYENDGKGPIQKPATT